MKPLPKVILLALSCLTIGCLAGRAFFTVLP